MSDEIREEPEIRSTSVEHHSWSPAQAVAILGGLVLLVIGALALATTGTDFSNVPGTRATELGMSYTCLSALVQLVVGVLLLLAGLRPSAAKGAMGFFGVATLAWGIVIVADTARLANMWGYNQAAGIFYIVVGGVLLLASLVSPVFFSERQRTHGRHSTYRHA